MSSGRRAVTAGSFWRTAPAAALRGFAKVPSPDSWRPRFSCSKSARGMKTSPRTSSSGTPPSAPRRSVGSERIVLRFAVMSSPTRPSPRVAPRTKRPRAEGAHGLAGHALGGAVGRDEVGEGRLQLAQLAHERVVLRVGDLGTRLRVIEVIVMVDLLPQLADALESVSPRHGASA